MEHKNYINTFCSIKNGSVSIDGKALFEDQSLPASDFIKSIYKHFLISYPKFYKMDQLSRLAFVASELILKNNPITIKNEDADIAIIIANSASSLETDKEHQRNISDKNNNFASPAVFVYTLPNILIGEIAIRNSIKGENTFFIFDKFEADFMSSYINSLLNNNKIKCCITGWVDFYDNKYEAFLYTVEKEKGNLNLEHNSDQLKKIYNN
jgi:hypothetical protein